MNNVRLVLLGLLYASLVYTQWHHMSVNQSKNIPLDDGPYPGGINGHTLIINTIERYLYLFGGFGINNVGTNGIY